MANRENVFLRKDGRFEARYRKGRDNNGKLIYGYCYGKTYEEAWEKARWLQLQEPPWKQAHELSTSAHDVQTQDEPLRLARQQGALWEQSDSS